MTSKSIFIDLYTFFHRNFSLLKYCIFGTSYLERRWQERPHVDTGDWGEGRGAWVVGYRDSIHHPHRKLLVDTISRYAPFDTALEIGSNCGPNLFLLARKFPKSQFYGIDINKEAIDFGNFWFKNDRIYNVELKAGFADCLSEFGDKSVDIVFTDAVLIYIGSDKIDKVINELFRVTKKGIILFEWHNSDNITYTNYFDGNHWIRDYSNLLRYYTETDKITITKIQADNWADKNWQKYGTIIEIGLC